ncbi:MAG: hypothetical protein AAFP08_06690 [Bacteroidota bacterium]
MTATKNQDMTCFNISLTTVLLRFYLMMAIVLIAGFSGMWWLAIFALPVFLSIMIGVQFKPAKKNATETNITNKVTLKPNTKERPVAA